jgi:predicted MPP superfamily phosphohydrolase
LLKTLLSPLKPPLPVFAVRGYRDRKKFWDELPRESRIVLLSNSHRTLEKEGEKLTFLGIQTAHASHLDRGINQLRETLQPLPAGDFRILLGQSADLLRIAQGLPIDLILAVDNLHYQTRIPGWGVPRRDTKVPYDWGPGWIREGLLSLYLNPGLGTRWIPFRFFYRPEITVIRLERISIP